MEIDVNTIKKELEAYVDEKFNREVKHLRMTVDSLFDVIEIREKAMNMKLGGLLGHAARKKQEDAPTFDSLDEAIEYAKKLKEKNSATAVK